MGEIADYMVDQLLDEEGSFFFGGHRKKFRTRAGQLVTCKHCGATGLFWGQFRGEWVLRNADTTSHACRVSTEGFEDLDK